MNQWPLPRQLGKRNSIFERNTAYGGYGDAIVLDAAAGTGMHLPCAPVLREIFETTAAQAGDDLDWAAIAEFTRQRAGR